eukprot:3767569-Amphidinium_carterae.1
MTQRQVTDNSVPSSLARSRRHPHPHCTAPPHTRTAMSQVRSHMGGATGGRRIPIRTNEDMRTLACGVVVARPLVRLPC